MEDSQVRIEGRLIDIADTAWREEKLPNDLIDVPPSELPDPDADNGDSHITMKEQEQKWVDLALNVLRLGKHCSCLDCKELDFLPLTCQSCKLIFCKNHIFMDQHKCSYAEYKEQTQISAETYVCTFTTCNSFSAVEMKCSECHKHFCLKHRYHGCLELTKEETEAKRVLQSAANEQFSQSISDINKIINQNIKKSLSNPKKQEAAQKINLMRLKAKAQGPQGIPVESRIYFSVFLPKVKKTPICKPVFISKDWTVGRMIDSISDTLNIINENNVASANKLRLFRRLNGMQISLDMSVKLINLIDGNKINNGETIILEYVNANEDLDCYYLKNFEEYKDS